MTSIQRFVQITAAFDPEATRALGQAFDTAFVTANRKDVEQPLGGMLMHAVACIDH